MITQENYEKTLKAMNKSYDSMTDEQRNAVIFEDAGKQWTPTLLLKEVFSKTDFGMAYVESWSENLAARDAERTKYYDAILARMKSDYEKMPESEKNFVLFAQSGVDWTPTLLLKEVEDKTEFGMEYVDAWIIQEYSLHNSLENVLMALGAAVSNEKDECHDCNCNCDKLN